MKSVLVFCASIALLFAASTANSAPLFYDEAIDGDLEAGDPALVLGFGANVIKGNTHQNPGPPPAIAPPDFSDFDFFLVLLPVDSILTSISVEGGPSVQGAGNLGSFNVATRVSPGQSSDLIIQETLPDFQPFSLDFPIGASFLGGTSGRIGGAGIFAHLSVDFNLLGGGDDMDYTVTFNVENAGVSTVPVPATLPFLVSGIVALGWAARRRRQRR